jgi:membrane-associated protein
LLHQLLEIFSDLPKFLDGFVAEHGVWVYAMLFAIIFAETGLVVTPFLPGDSLLFAVGALAARPERPLDLWVAIALLTAAAVIGDAVNYAIGKRLGPRIFFKKESAGLIGKLMNRRHLEAAGRFFERHGGKAVIMARFVPIVRTFVPFVAGAGAMNYRKFALYNVVGAVAWVGICVGAGYIFGNIPVVQHNFELVVVGIVIVSLLPMVYEIARAKLRGGGEEAPPAA